MPSITTPTPTTKLPCEVCGQAHVAMTTFSALPETVVLLGLPRPEHQVFLQVCHGCYLRGVSLVLRHLGLPKPVAAQLPLPLSAPKAAS